MMKIKMDPIKGAVVTGPLKGPDDPDTHEEMIERMRRNGLSEDEIARFSASNAPSSD